MIAAIARSSNSTTLGRIVAATPEAGVALGLSQARSQPDLNLQQFLKLAALCEHNPSHRPEWRSGEGCSFTLENAGMSLPDECSTVLIRLIPARNNTPGTSGFWRSALQFGLTAREASVLEHLLSGATDKKIGEALKISQHTARAHIRKIYRKLGVAGRVEAIGKVLKHPSPPAVPPPKGNPA